MPPSVQMPSVVSVCLSVSLSPLSGSGCALAVLDPSWTFAIKTHPLSPAGKRDGSATPFVGETNEAVGFGLVFGYLSDEGPSRVDENLRGRRTIHQHNTYTPNLSVL